MQHPDDVPAGSRENERRLEAEVVIRPLVVSDAAGLAALSERNRADIERVSPPQPPETFTEAGQIGRITSTLEDVGRGTRFAWTIQVNGRLAGDISLHAIHRGPLQTANVGYMVDAELRGRGVASAALRLVVAYAFTELRLHRLDAGAMPGNVGSQRVLEKAGFTRVGLMRRFLFVRDAWEDHVLYELVGPDFVPST